MSSAAIEPAADRSLGGDRLLVARLADLDLAEPPLEIVEVGGQAEDGHDLRGDGDVEACLARDSRWRRRRAR